LTTWRRGAKVFNGQASAPSAVVSAGSVEDKFSTAPARNHHPTVKSTALMSWLIRLVTPPAAPDGREPLVVDLFAGSGSGGVAAAVLGGVRWHGYDLDPEYVEIAQRRISFARLPKEVQNARRDQYFIDWSAL
jgi:DNA modification methylase